MKKILSLLCFLILLLSFSSLASANLNAQIGYSDFKDVDCFVADVEYLLGTNHSLGLTITNGSKRYTVDPYTYTYFDGTTVVRTEKHDTFNMWNLYYKYYFSHNNLNGLYLSSIIGYNKDYFKECVFYGANIGYKLCLSKNLNLSLNYNVRQIDSETYNGATLLIGYYFSDNI